MTQAIAWIYKTTPVGHDAALVALAAALRRSRASLDSGDGLYERVGAETAYEIALVGRASAALEKFASALGLKLIAKRELKFDEGWQPVDER